jgi:hypothetical protein
MELEEGCPLAQRDVRGEPVRDRCSSVLAAPCEKKRAGARVIGTWPGLLGERGELEEGSEKHGRERQEEASHASTVRSASNLRK